MLFRLFFCPQGFLLDKKIGVGQPKRIENAVIMVANTAMDTDKVKIYGSRVKVDSLAKVAEIEEAEKDKMREKCKKIVDHGINCFINRQLIYNLPEQIFAESGVMAIEHADFVGVERLAAVTGGEVGCRCVVLYCIVNDVCDVVVVAAEIVSTFDHPELVKLGRCKLIEEVMIGEDSLIRFSGVSAGAACTVVVSVRVCCIVDDLIIVSIVVVVLLCSLQLRGSSSHLLDEAERSLHDALCVLTETMKEPRVVYGGGCMEVCCVVS